MAETLDTVVAEIKRIQTEARAGRGGGRPRWPMIVLNTPKGWTGPKIRRRAKDRRDVSRPPGSTVGPRQKSRNLRILESWMLSYKPHELFDKNGRLVAELAELAPKGDRRMGANPMPTAERCCAICGCPRSQTTR